MSNQDLLYRYLFEEYEVRGELVQLDRTYRHIIDAILETLPDMGFGAIVGGAFWAGLAGLLKARTGADAATAEQAARLDPTPPTDPGLVGPVHRWVRGKSLRDTLQGADLAAGDFVRSARLVLDGLIQVAKIADDQTAKRARNAADMIRRGVVDEKETAEMLQPW